MFEGYLAMENAVKPPCVRFSENGHRRRRKVWPHPKVSIRRMNRLGRMMYREYRRLGTWQRVADYFGVTKAMAHRICYDPTHRCHFDIADLIEERATAKPITADWITARQNGSEHG